jgi:hypothetical protein
VNVNRPPTAQYEVHTAHGEIYLAEGDVIEQGGGWFTLWTDELVAALRVPEADIRAVRQVIEGEWEARGDAETVDYGELLEAMRRTLGIEPSAGAPDIASALLTACRELEKSEAARTYLLRDRECLRAALDEVLREFRYDTHPGQSCKQTGHVAVATVQRWRDVLASVEPLPAGEREES